MKIEKPELELVEAKNTKEQLEFFLQQPTATQVPPCPNCTDHKSYYCNCRCEDAHRALSSHPTEFPIERNVTPLVFGIVSTRVAQTCWSCEGHMDSDNNLISLPRVSFYVSSPVYAQLLHKHVVKLNIKKALQYTWQLVLTDYSQTWAQTFSVVPDLNFERNEVHLGALQNDLKVIAEDMQNNLKSIARTMMAEINTWIEQNTSKH